MKKIYETCMKNVEKIGVSDIDRMEANCYD